MVRVFKLVVEGGREVYIVKIGNVLEFVNVFFFLIGFLGNL